MQIEAPGQGSEEQVVRLESDEDLVKVVTVHKSKGLEYPVVFLPFAADFREYSDSLVRVPSLMAAAVWICSPARRPSSRQTRSGCVKTFVCCMWR